jgi:chromosome segregation ATPase
MDPNNSTMVATLMKEWREEAQGLRAEMSKISAQVSGLAQSVEAMQHELRAGAVNVRIEMLEKEQVILDRKIEKVGSDLRKAIDDNYDDARAEYTDIRKDVSKLWQKVMYLAGGAGILGAGGGAAIAQFLGG